MSWTPEATTPGNKKFLDAYHKMFGNQTPAEDAADAYATAQVMQAAVKAVGKIDDQLKLADWLRTHTVDTILGPLKWAETGAPQGQFLIGQWQSGQSEIVMPKAAATSDQIVQAPAAASG